MKNEISIPSAEMSVFINDGSSEETYEHQSLVRIVVNDPKTLKLICDHQEKQDGFVIEMNTDQPVRLETTLRGIDSEFKRAIIEAHNKKYRVGFLVLDTDNGTTITARQGIIAVPPKNRTIDATETMFDSQIVIETARKNYDEEYE